MENADKDAEEGAGLGVAYVGVISAMVSVMFLIGVIWLEGHRILCLLTSIVFALICYLMVLISIKRKGD